MLRFYTIYDSKAQVYLEPFVMRSDGLAERAFRDLLGDQKTVFCRYPADFTLFCTGSFDELTGVVASMTMHSLGNGLQFRSEGNGNTERDQVSLFGGSPRGNSAEFVRPISRAKDDA